MISAARQEGRQCDSWGAIALHPLDKLGHRWGQLLQNFWGQVPVPGCRQAGTAGETVSMRQPKLSSKGCLEEPDLTRMPWESHKHGGKEEGTGFEQQNPAQPDSPYNRHCFSALPSRSVSLSQPASITARANIARTDQKD